MRAIASMARCCRLAPLLPSGVGADFVRDCSPPALQPFWAVAIFRNRAIYTPLHPRRIRQASGEPGKPLGAFLAYCRGTCRPLRLG